jgi:sugar phosphate isomerase/epimerase
MMSCQMPGYSPAEIADAAVYCGMDAIDFIGMHDTDAHTLRKAADDAGIRIAAHTMLKEKFLYDEPDFMDEFKASLDAACIMNAPIMMLPPFPRETGGYSMAEDRKAWIDYYAQACPLAKAAGIQLTVESTGYDRSPITTGDEVLEVLRQVPDLRVTFDHGNTATADDPIAAYHKLAPYIVHFHLKDWKIYPTPQQNTTLKRDGRYYADALIGTGDMDLKLFWQNVSAEHKQLYVNLETLDYSGKLNHREALKLVSDNLRNW